MKSGCSGPNLSTISRLAKAKAEAKGTNSSHLNLIVTQLYSMDLPSQDIFAFVQLDRAE
jgi:hypothetical protein